MSSNITIEVKLNQDIFISQTLQDVRSAQTRLGENITKLSAVFDLGCLTAKYRMPDAAFDTHKLTNDTGYFDPLTKAKFVDRAGNTLRTGDTVAATDNKSNRNLVIVVLAEGLNFVLHERYPAQLNTPTVIVCTGNKPPIRNLIGMHSGWIDDVDYDLVMCAEFFGFEFNRAKNYVEIPNERPVNKIEQLCLVNEVINTQLVKNIFDKPLLMPVGNSHPMKIGDLATSGPKLNEHIIFDPTYYKRSLGSPVPGDIVHDGLKGHVVWGSNPQDRATIRPQDECNLTDDKGNKNA